MVIYKIDGSKSMEMDETESTAVYGLWLVYHRDFTTLPEDYSIRIQGKKVYLFQTTLIKPKPPENSELRLDI